MGEENGNAFRDHFAESSEDDHHLLARLPTPWNDVTVEKEIVMHASSTAEEHEKKPSQKVSAASPQHSPRLTSTDAPNAPASDDHGADHHSKRAVLLCFNENVRSADDVFRCHNEFIRD